MVLSCPGFARACSNADIRAEDGAWVAVLQGEKRSLIDEVGEAHMAGSVNKVILVGNLGRDPEVRSMQDGNKVVNLAIATSERWRDKSSGEMRDKTEWHRVVIFNERLADVAERYLSKGRQVYLEGQLQTRKWTDQSGQEKYTTEIVLQRYRGELTLLGGRGDSAGGMDDGYGGGNYGAMNQGGTSRGAMNAPSGGGGHNRSLSEELDDDIPF